MPEWFVCVESKDIFVAAVTMTNEVSNAIAFDPAGLGGQGSESHDCAQHVYRPG